MKANHEHHRIRPSREEIAARAYALWEYRGRPLSSGESDWRQAEQELIAAAASLPIRRRPFRKLIRLLTRRAA